MPNSANTIGGITNEISKHPYVTKKKASIAVTK
jgi:hypothetical protein